MKKHKIWQFNEFNREEAEKLAQQAGVSPLVAGILLNRGIKDAKSVREFLYGSAEPYHDPFLMKDMPKAAERILRGIDDGERISDFILFLRFTAITMWTASAQARFYICF